ncbi:amino acid adenylation domain-containing protein [Streptomyces sp. MP131-18]|uniref:amino acid adenylation domain-containing protein n=1 Tax=Streptomyces sp. MP131-18 TaxID=1857892 RepID=UPI00097BC8D8|nr:amino acid adenylation domain-containing protein [Streptomyces sp. MP131-18]ONK12121.1 Plipastatin synthase subunit C [Streptomyces sp. MP131-18]
MSTGPAGSPLIHTAVEYHAARTPDAVALVRGSVRVTYAELDAAAGACATALEERGAGPGGFVPVVMPRSPALVAVLLGVLKTGAAYAVLDPGWPLPRLRALLGLLRPRVAVAPGAADAPGALGDWAGAVWSPPPEGEFGRLAERATRRPGRPVDGSSPATVFFTSGTTGRPKAVVSGHRATTSLFGGGFAPFASGPTMIQAAPPTWDGFTLETWGPLLNGGTCVLPDGAYLMPGTLRGLADEHGVDTVWLTASLFHLFLDEDPGCFQGLRQVLTGAERLSVPRARAFLERHPTTALTNGYGPVETCVFATARRVRSADCATTTGIPIGVPVPGRRVHLLTDGREAAAPGTAGEICVSGEGLALGYLGDPRLTAERFPVLPLDGVPTRVYRTGDQGFLDGDGVLHFLGRGDRQVKIRGHRVEPEEVEAAARDVSGVRECAVVPVPGEDESHEGLALFYTQEKDADGADRLDARTLRRTLAAALPRHLVPERVHSRERLPLTASGKLDRAALTDSLRRPDHPEGDL